MRRCCVSLHDRCCAEEQTGRLQRPDAVLCVLRHGSSESRGQHKVHDHGGCVHCPLPCCRVLTTHVHMADLLRKTALLALLLFALLTVLVVQLWQLGRRAAVQHQPKSSKKKVRFVGAEKSMGDYRSGAGREHGMEGAGFTNGTDVREHRFDPALYSHLPSWQQPLPDDNHWEPPSSTLPLGWGLTLTSYDTVGIPHRRASSLGPMSALLGKVREGGGHPLDLHLSPSCSMHVSRTLIVDHSSDGRRPMRVATDVPTKGLSSASVNPQQEVAMKNIGAAAADSVQRGVTGGTTAAESLPVIERIIARVSNMRATGQGEQGGVGNAGCEEEGEVDDDDEDDSDTDEEEEDGVQEVTARGGKKKGSNGHGKGKAKKGGEGGGGNRRGLWDLNESLVLVQCKRDQEDYLANVGSNFARLKTEEWKWTDISNRMRQQGVMRDWDSCMKRWENVIGHYKKVLEREKESGVQSFFTLTAKQSKQLGYKFTMDQMVYDAIDGMQQGNQAIHLPNLADSGIPQPQQSQQGEQSHVHGPPATGETSASENGEGEGGDGCGTRSSGSAPHGKRKNARQLAFDSVTDVMKTHSTVVADSVDRASKRPCEVIKRQCDIMEREAMMQERQCEVLDAGQRMLCDALLKIASAFVFRESMDVVVALRGRIAGRTVAFYEMRHHRDKDCGRAFDFVHTVTRYEVRHFEVDDNERACLRLTVGYGFARGLLTHVVAFATKVGDAIPDRWDFGVDVLADLVDLLVSNVAMEFNDRLDKAAANCWAAGNTRPQQQQFQQQTSQKHDDDETSEMKAYFRKKIHKQKLEEEKREKEEEERRRRQNEERKEADRLRELEAREARLEAKLLRLISQHTKTVSIPAPHIEKKKSPRTKARMLREIRSYLDESKNESDEVKEEAGRLVDAIEKRKGKHKINGGEAWLSNMKMRASKFTPIDIDDLPDELWTPPTRKRDGRNDAREENILEFALDLHQKWSAIKAPELKKICNKESIKWTKKETAITELVRCRTKLVYGEGGTGNQGATSLSGK
ncbi:hypothetical protein CBR_g24263 [Chara braunii]|uniref:Myb-like domain-containing protein n=1 Tax=Chara braunii TaxID=69332 RepID=A0A388JMH1_CHABU|nr:hypothetical protein CBR_g24263 [Chara braunii]|eukprot:GBG58912.1 hypothetical protein CBR_g24263 [Chara braunii]